MNRDLIGLGWRAELAPSILSNLDKIDVIELIIDDYFKAPIAKLRSLSTLAKQVPMLYHGVGLGLATSLKLDQKRIEALARVFDYLSPDLWSEHLAFVRADKFEIGHLAAPPRNVQTLDGALNNLEQIKRIVGTLPVLENIATLIDPPGSRMSEPQWVSEILGGAGCNLLLDLHNLYANALNFGYDPIEYLESFPLNKVKLVHLSGGKWIQEPPGFEVKPNAKRLLDDHIHDVPDPVFELLYILGQKLSQPLTVIIERDGHYPDFNILLDQVAKARSVLSAARSSSRLTKGDLVECAIL